MSKSKFSHVKAKDNLAESKETISNRSPCYGILSYTKTK